MPWDEAAVARDVLTTMGHASAALMVVRLAGPGHRAGWDAFVAARPEADPLQTWAWGEANATAGERPVRVLVTGEGGSVRGLAQLLIRNAGFGRTVAYAPHGPLWDRDAADADARQRRAA